MSPLQGKVVVVTGATGGIGRALCLELAGHGCRLGLLSRTPDKLQKLAFELLPTGATVNVQAVDIGERAEVHAAIAAVQRELGPVDVLIHNAGIALLTEACAPDLDGLEQMLKVNYLGAVYALEAVLPTMLARGSGQVAAISSIGAWRALPWCAGYAASKSALGTYLESLRPPLRRRGIQVSTIYPGFVRTSMSEALPLRFWVHMLTPQTAARHIVRVIIKGKREAWFPWYHAAAMGVLRRLPVWLFDRLMAAAGRWGMTGEY